MWAFSCYGSKFASHYTRGYQQRKWMEDETPREWKIIEIAFGWGPGRIRLPTTRKGLWPPHYMSLGRPLVTFFWTLKMLWSRGFSKCHGHGSWLVCEVALRSSSTPLNKVRFREGAFGSLRWQLSIPADASCYICFSLFPFFSSFSCQVLVLVLLETYCLIALYTF